VYKDLTDSINYAKNIQSSILPNFEQLKNKLRIYSYLDPKDVVGGDFYGFYELPDGNKIIFLIDCTGHGVPGGFLTVIAKALLDKIVLQMEIDNCTEIIQNLNSEFRLFFGSESQRENIKFEGLVIALCYIDHTQRLMSICAAGTSIYYTKGGQICRFRGSRDSVGYEETMQGLETMELPLEKESRVYMFSDGVQDQFGGSAYKKYSTRRLLASIEAAKLYAKDSLDFVFIDASHDYKSVLLDLQAWWPLVKLGGWMGGHDVAAPGVSRALSEFFGSTYTNVGCSWVIHKVTDNNWRGVCLAATI
jgi:serine phosphatase RsbU (regulator of sigma subunit)